jgi:pseudaminic acid synthase
MDTDSIEIGGKLVGSSNSTFIVAELSCNHLNDFNIVRDTIKAASNAGVDALKLATLKPESMTINSSKEDFVINANSPWDGRTFYELYSETSMPYEWHDEIFKLAQSEGLVCFSTPYDKEAVDFLEKFDVPAYKIASFEITDIPLIQYAASKKKPIILSTGIATKNEIEEAIDACRYQGNNQIILLKCTSGYPTPLEDLNLNAIKTYKNDFEIIPGLSDHTLNNEIAIGAICLGAKFIEKHIILDRNLGGPDSEFSLEPNEFADLAKSIRNLERAFGSGGYELTNSQKASRDLKRSLYVTRSIKKGQVFNEYNIKSIRPGFGLPPKLLSKIIGKEAKEDIEQGTALKEEHIQNFNSNSYRNE